MRRANDTPYLSTLNRDRCWLDVNRRVVGLWAKGDFCWLTATLTYARAPEFDRWQLANN